MARYIDVDALRKEYNDWYKLFSWGDGTDAEKATIARAIQILDAHPTADVVEVKHGSWIDHKCSLCEFEPYNPSGLDTFNFCSNCGADMRGGNNDGR